MDGSSRPLNAAETVTLDYFMRTGDMDHPYMQDLTSRKFPPEVVTYINTRADRASDEAEQRIEELETEFEDLQYDLDKANATIGAIRVEITRGRPANITLETVWGILCGDEDI